MELLFKNCCGGNNCFCYTYSSHKEFYQIYPLIPIGENIYSSPLSLWYCGMAWVKKGKKGKINTKQQQKTHTPREFPSWVNHIQTDIPLVQLLLLPWLEHYVAQETLYSHQNNCNLCHGSSEKLNFELTHFLFVHIQQ